jgi:hypothetical protein
MVLTIWFGIPPAYRVYRVLATGLIVYQHRTNIVRLQTGTEAKLDETVIKGQVSQKSNTGQGDK